MYRILRKVGGKDGAKKTELLKPVVKHQVGTLVMKVGYLLLEK